LTVEPKSIEFTKGTAGTRRLIILTGKKPFAAQLLEHPVDGLTIDQPVPFGSTVNVKYDGTDVAGTYTVHIVDGAERNVFIDVVVKKPVQETEKGAKSGADQTEGTQSSKEKPSLDNIK
jgi:hypothetical protein